MHEKQAASEDRFHKCDNRRPWKRKGVHRRCKKVDSRGENPRSRKNTHPDNSHHLHVNPEEEMIDIQGIGEDKEDQ